MLSYSTGSSKGNSMGIRSNFHVRYTTVEDSTVARLFAFTSKNSTRAFEFKVSGNYDLIVVTVPIPIDRGADALAPELARADV